MVKNETLIIEEKEPQASLDRIQQLQVELKGNSPTTFTIKLPGIDEK